MERALSTIGVTSERIERWLGRPCGCGERKAKLNRLHQWAQRVLAGETHDPAADLDKVTECRRLDIPQPAPQPDLAVGITSAPRRKPTLTDSFESITTAGFTAAVFAEPGTAVDGLPEWCRVVQREQRLGAWFNFVDMSRQLLAEDTEYIVTFQDDIGLSPVALEMFRRFPWPRDCGALSFYTPAHYYPWEASQPKWRRVTTNSLWGALGFVFRSRDLRKMLDSPAAQKWRGMGARAKRLGGENVGNVDYIVGRLVQRELRKRVYTHVPSLSLHLATHSAMGHGGNGGPRNAAGMLTEIPDEQFGRRILKPTPKPQYLANA